jgi:hypothetical protein
MLILKDNDYLICWFHKNATSRGLAQRKAGRRQNKAPEGCPSDAQVFRLSAGPQNGFGGKRREEPEKSCVKKLFAAAIS